MRILYGPPKWRHIESRYGSKSFKMLDVGCGNMAAIQAKALFPNCEYHGIDNTKYYNSSSENVAAMQQFYEIELTSLEYGSIPDDYFDVIIMSHVLEHLRNGIEVIRCLTSKLKDGGLFYVEWPHPRSVNFPSMRNCLNFYDDPTHVFLYTWIDVCNIMRDSGLRPLEAKTRRSFWYLLCSPALIGRNILRNKGLVGPDLWEFLGFAQFVVSVKRVH